VYTPRNVSVSEGNLTYVDYGGRALAIVDWQRRSSDIYSRDPELAYEASYLFLLSRIGEFLDGRRMHRIHAMALCYRGKGVLALLPMGGGKSALTADLLKYPELQFLSDDSPFISADGRLHAFPLRLGLLPGSEQEIPPEYRRVINRMEFGPKVLVDYRYLAHRVVAAADPGIVFLGYRSLGTACRIESAGAAECYRSMITDCVVGLGLCQGLEFLLRSSTAELAGKVGIAASRLAIARRLFRRSQVYRLILGRDREHNSREVMEFVRRRLG